MDFNSEIIWIQYIVPCSILGWIWQHHCRKITYEFEELALDEHNYPTWAMDVKISLALYEMYEAIVPPAERIVPLLESYKYNALSIL
jgi:hypothetical protein